jgi:hypothetical protein
LFGIGAADQAGASATIGKLLADMALAPGTHIQINLLARHFVFPWSILYPPAKTMRAESIPINAWELVIYSNKCTAAPETIS